MPRISARLNDAGVAEITHNGDIIGLMVKVEDCFYINGVRYSPSFLQTLSEFEDDYFSPAGNPQSGCWFVICTWLIITILAAIAWAFTRG